MKKKWDKDIRDQLKDFSKKAPEGLLDNVKAEMLRRGLSSTPVTDQPRHIPLTRIASVAAALILLLLGISHLWQEPSVLPTLSEHTDSFQTVTPPPIVSETEVQESQPLVSNPSGLIAKVAKKASSNSDILFPKEENTPQVNNEEVKKEEERKEKEQPKDNEQQETKKEYVETSSKPKWTYNVSSRKKSSISIGVYYSGVVAQVNPKIQMDSDISIPAPGVDKDSTEVSQSRCAPAIYNLTGRATHHIPVKLGFSFRYDLNERWNLQSGLTYSYLASDISETAYNGVYDTKQKLHYIGIPLQIGYKIGEGKRFSSYIAAGFQVEKLVSGKADVRHSKNGQLQCSYIQNVSDKRLLYSALASFGVEYYLSKKFSLYAEPGFHYYFKNGNNLQTHYNEKPLNLNLTIGFRFHHKTK